MQKKEESLFTNCEFIKRCFLAVDEKEYPLERSCQDVILSNRSFARCIQEYLNFFSSEKLKFTTHSYLSVTCAQWIKQYFLKPLVPPMSTNSLLVYTGSVAL